MAKSVLDWLKKGVDAVFDPDREKRIEHHVALVQSDLVRGGANFSIAESLLRHQVRMAEIDDVKERIYRNALVRAWQDGTVNDLEQRQLQWIVKSLQLTASQVSRWNSEFALAAFRQCLTSALADGCINDAEYAQLESIAHAAGLSTGELVRRFFREDAERVLRGFFARIVSDGQIGQAEWQQFMTTAARLGLSHAELMHVVQAQSVAFMEHILADAKSDESLSSDEEALIRWMLQTFAVPPQLANYVHSQLHELKLMTEIAAGRLPSLNGAFGIETRSGEIVHYVEDVIYETTKMLKSGPRVERHNGRAVITDSRLVFSSATKSIALNLRSVIQCSLGSRCVEIRSNSKGGGNYYFLVNPRLACAVLRTAVGRVNQTIVATSPESAARYIPREVRQRAWQRYGGRCAECSSDQYLEFDHIIPVARGGSNTDNNVQLLCRRCNLKKSDNI